MSRIPVRKLPAPPAGAEAQHVLKSCLQRDAEKLGLLQAFPDGETKVNN